MDSNHRPSPSQSDELTSALTRDIFAGKDIKTYPASVARGLDNETFAGLFALLACNLSSLVYATNRPVSICLNVTYFSFLSMVTKSRMKQSLPNNF